MVKAIAISIISSILSDYNINYNNDDIIKTDCRQEEIIIKINFLELCLLAAILYGFEAWGKISTSDMEVTEKI